MTCPSTPKPPPKKLLTELRRLYFSNELKVEPIQMPIKCPEVVLVYEGGVVQAFAVKGSRPSADY
jgi:hypothetical protein